MRRRLAVAFLVAFAGVAQAVPALAQKVDPPRKIKNVEPVYPAPAQAARVQGEVVVEATVGIDGKVHDAKVIGSIPLLDEAALAAVRQWEYEPVVVDGSPRPVVMTVRVKFTLAETAPPRPPATGPLVLARDGQDWTVNGTPLLDDNLRFWLHDVMRTAPGKDLFVRADATRPYSELIDVLATATAVGVERLYVFAGDAEPPSAARVWLEPTAQKTPGVTLPIADVGSPVKGAPMPLVIARTGATAGAKAGVQRAAAGAVVRLRIDASRKIADVWDVLKLGPSRPVEGFALAVQLPAGALVAANAPETPEQQQEWTRLSKQISDLFLSDRPMDESVMQTIPMLEKFVRRNPNIADGHFKLATSYEYRATLATESAEAKHADLKRAIDEFTTTAELLPSPDARFVCTLKIAELYGPDQLNDRVWATRYAERLADEYPSRPESHLLYARLLHDAGDVAGAANALRHGRTVSAMPLIGQLTALQYLVEQVKADRRLGPAETRKLLDEALALSDAVIADPARTEMDYRLATMGKSIVLDMQAERLPHTAQERLALLVESDRWSSPLDQHKNGMPPPAAKLSAAEAREMEWRAVRRWNTVLADDGHLDTAIDAVAKYSSEHPDLEGPHSALADLLSRAVEKATDASSRANLLERLASELQRVIELAAGAADQRYAFVRLVDATGPKGLNRLDRQETAARTMLKRQPQEPAAHYALATVLLRAGKGSDADKVLRGARSSLKPTPSSRAAMAVELVHIARQDDLPDAAARRLFDEADSLIVEARKLKGGADDVHVIESRMAWLNLSADRFETDPVRAATQREEAKQLKERALALRAKEIR